MYVAQLDGQTVNSDTHYIYLNGLRGIAAFYGSTQVWGTKAVREWKLTTSEGNPVYDSAFISADDGYFSLINPYIFHGVEQEIDKGKCGVVMIDNTAFETIECITIT